MFSIKTEYLLLYIYIYKHMCMCLKVLICKKIIFSDTNMHTHVHIGVYYINLHLYSTRYLFLKAIVIILQRNLTTMFCDLLHIVVYGAITVSYNDIGRYFAILSNGYQISTSQFSQKVRPKL